MMMAERQGCQRMSVEPAEMDIARRSLGGAIGLVHRRSYGAASASTQSMVFPFFFRGEMKTPFLDAQR